MVYLRSVEMDPNQKPLKNDLTTAEAFAKSWMHLPAGSVYSFEQFEEWLSPITREEVEEKTVLELGCGNGSLLVHLTKWRPSRIVAVELGPSAEVAEKNMAETDYRSYSIVRADLTTFSSDGFDLVYCIGVLHHLANPDKGFDSVLKNVKPAGRFHCWVYAREGNAAILHVVDPLRKITSRLPWQITKYLVATPLAAVYFIYAKLLRRLSRFRLIRKAPLFEYSVWIALRPFAFFRHVAFDQLVSPRTGYIDRQTVEKWLSDPRVLPDSSYIVFRNGNSWKFGGRVR